MLPKVTAVMVCWNHARFVEKAIRSALAQTYPNVQFIVFDNDSTDGSGDIIQRLADAHGFTFIRQPNIGLIKTLNAGLRMADGKYYTAFDADDMWMADKTERQVAYLEANPDVHLVCGDMDPIDENDQPVKFRVGSWPGEVTFQTLMRDGCNVQSPTAIYRTETLRKIGNFDESTRFDDYTTALHFTHAGYRVVNTGEKYTLYRRHGGNWSAKPYYHDNWLVGQLYRNSPEYRAFVHHNLSGYFRLLAEDKKLDAVKLLINEPLAWTWDDIGIGILKLLMPPALVRFKRKLKSRRQQPRPAQVQRES
jgi:alpha-1,3-rhamnosyltransferase